MRLEEMHCEKRDDSSLLSHDAEETAEGREKFSSSIQMHSHNEQDSDLAFESSSTSIAPKQ